MAGDHPEDTTTATDQPRICTSCGAGIDTTEWYPVVADPEEGYRIYAFCDETCRERWRQETGE
ncbi:MULTISPECIES: DUF7576 family protein [Haloarcula]|uniref:Small CPxCG-related zinc finger protein n=1 Tax=Haloarcula pellucida TaxID=1427151 RepID=A0A830GNJ6_9EURY|nr:MULTISPECIES: hypothetical protein [Halomicroarcula]MBX0348479.1 hypothetical protein [Halomicroarcula pellucida]MDS0278303.1 hypothetical protein [Halomicroarcula sp. S1AR25-4]GGN93181.1 hypothetical protein GCM10009030_18280 [Halomicroarcula pellucida]